LETVGLCAKLYLLVLQIGGSIVGLMKQAIVEFSPQVDYASVVSFRYRAISDSTCDKNGGHFQDGCHGLIEIL